MLLEDIKKLDGSNYFDRLKEKELKLFFQRFTA
jgi:hypothetical protein